jgi:class 3 adenylate cyclase
MPMPDLPSGTVTLLFTDIEGSTRLLARLRERYGDVLREHRRLLRAVFEENGGREIDVQGDGFFVAFSRAKDALATVIAGQRAIVGHDWPDGVELRVRMGLHTGEPSLGDEGYHGLVVHQASRVCAAGHGGQILVSNATRELIEDELPAGVELRDLGEHRLKDLVRPVRLFQLDVDALPSEFPPLRTLEFAPVAPPSSAAREEASIELGESRGRRIAGRRYIAAVAGLAVVGSVVAGVLLLSGHGHSSPTHLAPLVPEPLWKDCTVKSGPNPRAVESAVCVPASGPTVSQPDGWDIYLYPDGDSAERGYERIERDRGIAQDRGTCTVARWDGEGPWYHGPRRPGGRRMCFVDGNAAVIVWTHESFGQSNHGDILAIAQKAGRDYKTLLRWFAFWHHRIGKTRPEASRAAVERSLARPAPSSWRRPALAPRCSSSERRLGRSPRCA